MDNLFTSFFGEGFIPAYQPQPVCFLPEKNPSAPRHQGRVRELFNKAFLLQVVDPHRPILRGGFRVSQDCCFFLLHVASFQGGGGLVGFTPRKFCWNWEGRFLLNTQHFFQRMQGNTLKKLNAIKFGLEHGQYSTPDLLKWNKYDRNIQYHSTWNQKNTSLTTNHQVPAFWIIF